MYNVQNKWLVEQNGLNFKVGHVLPSTYCQRWLWVGFSFFNLEMGSILHQPDICHSPAPKDLHTFRIIYQMLTCAIRQQLSEHTQYFSEHLFIFAKYLQFECDVCFIQIRWAKLSRSKKKRKHHGKHSSMHSNIE